MTPDAPLTPVRPGKTSSTPTSRSASFSLPDEKSGSGRLRKIVSPGGTPGQQMGEEVEEEDGDVEDKDFKKKRAGHYGGEAEAMKLAQVRGAGCMGSRVLSLILLLRYCWCSNRL
jgi:hypothetical protein